MKKNISPLMKDTLRTIKNSLSRFLAIIAMTGLSAVVFIGLQAVIPNLRDTVVKRVEDNKIHDLRIHSYTGIRDKDKEIIKRIEGDKFVEYMAADVFDVKDKEYSVNIYTITEDIDTPLITEGRLPNKADEIFLDDLYMKRYGNQIGQKISFVNKKNQDDEETLKRETFSIVGYGKSVDYISNSRISTASSGDYFALVKKEAFNKKYPDYALVRLEENRDKDIATDDFKLYETKNISKVKKAFENRPQEVKEEIFDQAYKEINDAKVEIADGKKQIADGKQELLDSEKLLMDSKEELDQAKVEIADNRKKLDDAKKQLDDGYKELSDSKKILDNGKKELDQAKKQLDDGYKELSENEKLFQDKIKQGQDQLDQGQAQYDQGKKELDQALAQYQKGLDQFNKESQEGKKLLEDNKAKLDQAKKDLDQGLLEYEQALEKIDQGIKEIEKALEEIALAIKQIQENIPEGMTKEIAQENGLVQILELFDQLDHLQSQKKDLEIKLEDLQKNKEALLAQKPILDKAQADYEEGLKAYQEGLKQYEDKIKAAKKKLASAKAQIDEGQKQLEESKVLLEEGNKKFESEKKAGLDQLNKAKADLLQGQKEYDQGLADYQEGLKKYQDGKKTLDENYAKYQDGIEKLNQGQKDYQEGLKKYNDGLEDFKQGQIDYEKGLKEYQDGLKEFEDGKKEFESEKIKAEKDIAKAEEDIRKAEEDLEDLVIPNYRVEGIYHNPSFNGFISQISSLNLMSLIFTAMFYLVAILVTLTTVLRMVETERTQIGTLKALGYKQINILGKFLIYGLLAAVTGSILGSIIGQFVLMPPIARAYVASTNFDLILDRINYINPIIILLASVFIIGFTIYFTIHKSLQEEPANLMRPKPPTEAKRTLLEKIPFLWNRLSFLNKVSIRNLVRHKLRVLMIIIGVAGSFGLITMAFGIQNSVGNVGKRQFGQVYKYHAQVIYDHKKDDFKDFDKKIDQTTMDKIPIISQEASVLTPDGFEQNINIQATDDKEDLLNFVALRKRGTTSNYKLQDKKVIITEKLSMILDLSVGDNFKFVDKDGFEHQLEVQAITEQYFSHIAYMTKSTYQDLVDEKAKENSYLLKIKDYSEARTKKLKQDLSNYEANLAFIPISEMENTLKDISESLNIVILMIIAVSALLTFVVLYNLTNINISERYREIATIKVLGFRPAEVSSYIFKENLILTFIGILFGMVQAKIMHSIIVFSLSSESFLFDPVMNVMSFVWGWLSIIIFMGLVLVLSKKEMDRINMVEALKDF
ncbi:MAG: FtsX-like permease family protein [Tissierellia bacterium]|nr:FtsX-like permease family protein [Tissierellia bacterium]